MQGPGAVHRSGLPRLEGRLICANDSVKDNIWLNSSELALEGRPIGKQTQAEADTEPPPVCKLPRGCELLAPVSEDPNTDLQLGENSRPGIERFAAQKGAKRMTIILESLLNNMSLDVPVLVCNTTGYVEDCGICASYLACG